MTIVKKFLPYLNETTRKAVKDLQDDELKSILRKRKLTHEQNAFIDVLKETSCQYLYAKIENKKYSIKNQEDVISYFKNLLSEEDKESVFVLFLDAKNRIIDNKKVSEGTLTQCLLYPREIIKEALKIGALSIIIVHNHPSGDTTPSQADKKITKKLLFATKELDIALLDHIIVGTKGYYSFYENNDIDEYTKAYKNMTESIFL